MREIKDLEKRVRYLDERVAALEEENKRLKEENKSLTESLEFANRLFVENEIRRNEHEREVAEYIEELEGKLK